MSPPSDPPPLPLFHRDLGGAGAPPVVLLHGLLGSSRNWQTVGRELAATRRVFALDLRNHGQSPHDPDVSYPALAADVTAWLDAQGLGAAELIGHSMGGKVAMLIACREPARVARLVVVDIAPRDYDGPTHRAEFQGMNALDLGALQSRAQAERELEAFVPDWAMRKFLTTNLDRSPEGGWKWIVNLPALTAGLTAIEGNALAAPDRFGGPTLFIAGGSSGYVRPADRDLIRGHFPGARFETIAGSGHNPHIEAREAFVAAVNRRS
jgi:pimeloyl-ACP methyl ester carboxylesterase